MIAIAAQAAELRSLSGICMWTPPLCR